MYSKFRVFLFITALILSIPRLVIALKIKSLIGPWDLKDENGEYEGLKAEVPGGIYTDLMNNYVIDDVFYGNNDIESRWVAKKVWIYSKHFEVNDTMLMHRNVYLVFEGLDTFAEVYVNDVSVGSSDNMFVRYEYDVSTSLKTGINNLTVLFKSPIDEAARAFEEQTETQNYSVVPLCVPDEYNGECHVNYIRKMQSSFGWDWGPALPSVGIWKKVYLEAYNTSVIKDATVVMKEQEDFWEFTVKTYFARNNLKELKGTLIITVFTDLDKIEEIFNLSGSEFSDFRSFSIPKDHFKLWWPNGYGEQHLYVVKISYVSPDGSEQSIKRFRVGLRTIDLVQEPLSTGRSFYFKVNGVPVFAKGSNVIPIDALPERARNLNKIRSLLTAARGAHMNMLRVWGGGMYESDEFYQLADELGLMIWQDFMFACSMYPTGEKFTQSVKLEVEQQVRRLQHHPSIVLWAGNNENEAALSGDWYQTRPNYKLFHKDYVYLYIEIIRTTLLKNDNSRPFLTSSPTNGIKSDQENFVARNPYNPLYGDIHFYNYILDGWNPNIYPITRFSSEYGYQSLPSIRTLASATNGTNYSYSNQFLSNRQHHLEGYKEMLILIRKQLNLPEESSPNFDRAFIFYSQIYQAYATKIETEFNRMWMWNLNNVGKGYTMGSLYWQLNDVWAAPSWSGIDSKGRWKMLQYYAKDFFSPVIVKSHLNPSRDVDIYVVSDQLTPVFNATLKVETYNWTSFVPISKYEMKVDVRRGSQRVYSFWLDKYYKLLNCGQGADKGKHCFTHLTISNETGLIAPGNFLFPGALKDANMQRGNVKIQTVRPMNNTTFYLMLESENIAAFVWLESTLPGRFSENGFFQLNRNKLIVFECDVESTHDEIEKSLYVTHLMDPQYI